MECQTQLYRVLIPTTTMPKLPNSKAALSKKGLRDLRSSSGRDVGPFPHESDSLIFVNVSRNRAVISAARRLVRRYIRPLPRRHGRLNQPSRVHQPENVANGQISHVEHVAMPMPAAREETDASIEVICTHSDPLPLDAQFFEHTESVDVIHQEPAVWYDELHVDDPFEQFLRDIRASR